MKLLFDQNLSFKLCSLLSDLFPDSKPIRELLTALPYCMWRVNRRTMAINTELVRY